MYINRISFTNTTSSKCSKDTAIDLAQTLLAAWRMNGQAYGCEWSIFVNGETFSVMVLSPENESFDARFNSKYVTAATGRCETEGLLVTCEVLGEDAESAPACRCSSPSAYALFTNYVSLKSPIRCMDCFHPVALYRMNVMASGEFNELISWQSDYQSCDSLQMNCAVLEKEATRELSSIDSDLSKLGLEHCKALASLNGRPFYYYLYGGEGLSLQTELERLCPGCGSEWKLPSRLHDIFDFRCDRCSLLSNIAFDVRWKLP